MNFQAIRAANGQNVAMLAIATRIDGTTFIPSGTPKQNCKFTDANGEQQAVTIWQGKGQPIPPDQQGLTLSINISCKTGNQGRVNYGGFWNSTQQVNQQATKEIGDLISQPNPQQPTPQPSQKANQTKEVDWDAKELREKRGYAIRDAVLMQTTLATISNNIAGYLSEDAVIKLADKFVKYVYHGNDNESSEPGGDIPF